MAAVVLFASAEERFFIALGEFASGGGFAPMSSLERRMTSGSN
jgi:hypothetical protein